jgi:hypothetical protein
MSVSTWLVPLEGHPFDSQDLPKWLAGGDISAVDREGQMHLAIPASSTPQDQVLEVASSHLDVINGAATLLDPAHRLVRCDSKYFGIDDQGQVVSTVVAVGTGEIRAKGNAVGISVGGVPAPDPRKGALLPFLAAASVSGPARDALVILGRPRPTWSELFVIYELVQEASGGTMIAKRWISKADDDLFCWTANNRHALGIEARHGHTKRQPPPAPMPHANALTAIRSLVDRWLRSQTW